MATHRTETTWQGGVRFDVHQQGFTIPIDTAVEAGGTGQGISPKTLLLSGLAGCTGIDVALFVAKSRVTMRSLVIRVEGDLTEDHPKVYKTIRMVYEVGVDPADRPKVERAVNSSIEKYCGVYAMLAKTADIQHEIILV